MSCVHFPTDKYQHHHFETLMPLSRSMSFSPEDALSSPTCAEIIFRPINKSVSMVYRCTTNNPFLRRKSSTLSASLSYGRTCQMMMD